MRNILSKYFIGFLRWKKHLWKIKRFLRQLLVWELITFFSSPGIWTTNEYSNVEKEAFSYAYSWDTVIEAGQRHHAKSKFTQHLANSYALLHWYMETMPRVGRWVAWNEVWVYIGLILCRGYWKSIHVKNSIRDWCSLFSSWKGTAFFYSLNLAYRGLNLPLGFPISSV